MPAPITMTTSPSGRTAIARREGCRLTAYQDSVGVWTIGIGHTGRAGGPEVTPGSTISAAQADALFAADLEPFEAAVGRAVRVDLSQGQFDACVSLAFNIGAPAFAASTVARELNAGHVAAAADAFLLWNRPAVLAGRREDERAQFLAAAPAPKPSVPPARGGPSTRAQASRQPTRPKPSLWRRLLARLSPDQAG